MTIAFLAKNEYNPNTLMWNGAELSVNLKPDGGLVESRDGLYVQFPEQLDVHLAGLRFDGNYLKATLSDGSEAEVELSVEVVKAALGTLSVDEKDQIFGEMVQNRLNRFKRDLLSEIKGEQVTGFDGNPKGYLLSNNI